MLERAIALDPGYAHAHAWKACVLGQSTVTGWCADVEATRRALIGELTKALSLDENDSDVHRVLAAMNLMVHHNYDKALYHQERALALNPNYDLVVVQQGELLTWLGRLPTLFSLSPACGFSMTASSRGARPLVT